MILVKTPLRISLLGGGSDYPSHFTKHGGAVLAMTINKLSTIVLRRIPPHAQALTGVDNAIAPMLGACLRLLHEDGIEAAHMLDVPPMSGLGSSSAATVGLLNALHALREEKVSPENLAREAYHAERAMAGEMGGMQDHFMASLGGIRHIEFCRDGGVRASHVDVLQTIRDHLASCLMLVHTGIKRTFVSTEGILMEQDRRTASGENAPYLNALRDLAGRGRDVLEGRTVAANELGLLLHESWEAKKRLASGVSSPEIDLIYDRARRAGAIGGKMLGAGGGGYMLLFVEPRFRADVLAALPGLTETPFSVVGHGSRVIYNGGQ